MFIRLLVDDGAVGIDMDDRRSAGVLEFVAARALSHYLRRVPYPIRYVGNPWPRHPAQALRSGASNQRVPLHQPGLEICLGNDRGIDRSETAHAANLVIILLDSAAGASEA